MGQGHFLKQNRKASWCSSESNVVEVYRLLRHLCRGMCWAARACLIFPSTLLGFGAGLVYCAFLYFGKNLKFPVFSSIIIFDTKYKN